MTTPNSPEHMREQRQIHLIAAVSLAAIAALTAGCSPSSADSKANQTTEGSAAPESASQSVVSPTPSAAPSTAPSAAPTKRTYENFQLSNFDANSINIDNKYFPLKPGTRYEYDGSTFEEGKTLSHRVVFTVTNLTKMIGGVNAVVIWERDYSEGDLEEDELTMFAQDKVGNVWHLGQYSEFWDGKEFTAGRAWFFGHPADAKAGIMMKANPLPNQPDWSEGYAPAPYFWTDRAHVRAANQKTTVPTGTFDGVLITEEYNEEESTSIQLKYYAPGVGVVRVGWSGTDESKETLLMVHSEMLTAEKLAEVSRGALELETRANVYATAGPAVMR
jgi:hypothetical protein